MQEFFKTRFATVLLLAILVLVSAFTSRILYQQYLVNKEIDKLRNQADQIKKGNEQLTYLVKYFNTPEYKERQAREQLNLKKPGEFVVGIPQDTDPGADGQQQSGVKSNLQQWFEYFFNTNNELP